jgi:hypothetical protein
VVDAEIQDEQDLINAVPYINYALFGVGEHLERLHGIKKKYNSEVLWDLQADGNSLCDSRVMYSMMMAEIVCWPSSWSSLGFWMGVRVVSRVADRTPLYSGTRIAP